MDYLLHYQERVRFTISEKYDFSCLTAARNSALFLSSLDFHETPKGTARFIKRTIQYRKATDKQFLVKFF